MKKIILMVVVLGVILTGIAFAAESYVVQSVTGKVEREVSPGKWEALKNGATLTGATVVNTGLNSSLVLMSGDNTVTIKAMQKGTIENLASAGASTGVRIGGKISNTSTTVTSRGTASTSTASTRASEAAKEPEWVE